MYFTKCCSFKIDTNFKFKVISIKIWSEKQTVMIVEIRLIFITNIYSS